MRSLFFCLCAAVMLLTGCDKEPPKPIRHKLTLNADQPGAAAYVMGKRFDLPHEFRMTRGDYLFRIEKPGYAPAWFSCRVRPSGIQTAQNDVNGGIRWEAFTSPSHTIRLTPQGGSVLITSRPEAAEVVIDGRIAGSTPLVLTGQPVGRYTAQLRSPNYAEVSLNWEIRGSRPVTIRADLKSNIGEIRVSGEPDKARLFIDGRLVGTTPYRGSLAVGKHPIRIERDGYLPYNGHITVELGQAAAENYTLTASPGALEITSIPSGAQVTIDGKARGVTPLVLQDIPAGQYEIAVSLSGFDREEETVEVAAGAKVTRKFSLSSSRGGIELNVYPAGVKVYMDNREIGVVEPGEGQTQTKLIRIDNLSPGIYTIKAVHKRTDPEIRRIKVTKGKITRPPRIELWVPNAEIVWKENGRTELGMIHGESEKIILFGPAKGIRIEIPKDQLRSIKRLDINE